MQLPLCVCVSLSHSHSQSHSRSLIPILCYFSNHFSFLFFRATLLSSLAASRGNQMAKNDPSGRLKRLDSTAAQFKRSIEQAQWTLPSPLSPSHSILFHVRKYFRNYFACRVRIFPIFTYQSARGQYAKWLS